MHATAADDAALRPAPDAPTAADAAPEHAPDGDVRALLTAALDAVAAWRALAQAEFALALRSLRSTLVVALLAPVLLAGAWLSLIALAVAALHALGCGWFVATALACLAQAVLLAVLIRGVRRWLRDLTLPHSRAALERLLAP